MNKINFLDSVDWSFPVPISYGPNRINELPDICKTNNLARPLLVTDKSSKDLPFMKKILQDLNRSSINSDIFSDISPNPVDDEIYKGRSFYKEGKHDSIIAIGGGSGMDGGKAISLIANNSENLWDFEYEKSPIKKLSSFPPLICIPTTAGTGAETESTAMVTNSELGMKLCVWHPKQKPITALLDPCLTVSLPKNLTAWTGTDALVHGIEAFCVDSLYSVADGMALQGLNLIGNNLLEVYKNPDNLNARGAMLIGSCLTGISFLKGLGLVHAISHMVGAVYDTQHGLTNAVILPQVLNYNKNEIQSKINSMNFSIFNEPGNFDNFYSNITQILDTLDIPDNLEKIGVKDNKITELAAKSSKDSAAFTNPKKASIQDLEKIIKKTIKKAR